MSLTLILMRHAKSSWDDPALPDFDRPLNARGRKSAKAIGDWLRDQKCLPDHILCSSSVRTRETLKGLKLDARTEFLEGLYHASEDRMLRILQNHGQGKTVLMLGHNPGTAFLARRLLRTPPAHPKFSLYPTAATLVARFEEKRWQDIDFGSGTARDFIVPRELTE